jgi:hypothetical protein
MTMFEISPLNLSRRAKIVLGTVLVGSITQFVIWVSAVNSLVGDSQEPPQSAPTSSAPTTTAAAAPTPTAKPSAPTDSVLYAAYQLRVAEPEPDGYDRGEFGQKWADVDRNGCDQRDDVLRRDRRLHTKPGTNGCVLARAC